MKKSIVHLRNVLFVAVLLVSVAHIYGQTTKTRRGLKPACESINSSRELPDQYWTDIVTEQPEGYVVDENGDVHLHSAEALAGVNLRRGDFAARFY